MNATQSFLQEHGTKLIGFLQVTFAALAAADQELLASLFGPNGLKWILLASGLLTTWRGFYNSQVIARDPT